MSLFILGPILAVELISMALYPYVAPLMVLGFGLLLIDVHEWSERGGKP